MSKRGLGIGLDALLATSSLAREKEKTASNSQFVSVDGELADISITNLKPGIYQPRKDMSMEALEELSASIESQGIIQPIVVRRESEQFYEIIAGERRWRAAKRVGLKKVPCIIKNVSDNAAVAMALIENIQREDLNVIEEAQALERLQDEFELTHQQVAEVIGKSRTTVTNLLRLNQLDSTVKQLVAEKHLEMGHARALLALEKEVQVEIAYQIAKKKLTVRQTESLVKKQLAESNSPLIEKRCPTEHAMNLSRMIETSLQVKVDLNLSKAGKTKITISLSESEELETFLEKIVTKLK